MTTLRNWLPFELDKKCFLLSALKTDQQLHGMLFIRFRGERVPGILYLLLIRRTMRLLATLLTDELEKNDSERRLKRLLHNKPYPAEVAGQLPDCPGSVLKLLPRHLISIRRWWQFWKKCPFVLIWIFVQFHDSIPMY